ncbi:DUF262 domain-containing protein [Arthrobacter sp. ERGS1:01]|uniref:DUF262 domain-containing protein n=1 Tax=Arthrobacter sp. ERGS1:01 TaxID=1704044 RepID=UPI0009E92E69|nr:DUF262 domain-containing protein [Arthrobacter sp. ERGS1:01]
MTESTRDSEVFELSDEELEDMEEATPLIEPIVYSGQDFDVDGLNRRLRQRDIIIPNFGHHDEEIETSGFQRNFVWNRRQMDKFIESMLLGYPIPGIFLIRQSNRSYLVLDGQQRLKTIQYFYAGKFQNRIYSLRNVAEKFKGLTYDTLPDELRRTLDNAFIQATIVDAGDTPERLEAVYQIFERLNSGGTQLTAHEIRVALYAGQLIDYLETLNQDRSWRNLYGKSSSRIRDQELVLRILALYVDSNDYVAPLKSFLNTFCTKHKKECGADLLAAGDLFLKAAALLDSAVGSQALRRESSQVNTSQTDALFIGLMTRLLSGEISVSEVAFGVAEIKSNETFGELISESTSHEDRVKARVAEAIRIFSQF